MRSKKNKKKLIIAVVLGMVATVGVFSMVNGQKAQVDQLSQQLAAQQAASQTAVQAQSAPPAEETTSVMLAKIDIHAGEVITINKLDKKQYKKSEVPPSFFINENFVIGKTAAQDILQGKIITNDDLLASVENSLNIPPGMRAITISTSLIQGLASYIYIGSKIDLIAVKTPPEFIAQNIKIVALETVIDPSAAAEPAPPAPAAPAPAQPGQNAPAVTPAPSTTPPAAIGRKNTSADKALGITILVPVNIAGKIIDAMINGKLQVITRGNNDDKMYTKTIKSYSGSHSHPQSVSKLPPPPSGTGVLPPLPGTTITPVEKPKFEVEVIEANSKRNVSFDDASSNSSNPPSKELKDLLKLSN